MNNYRFGNTVIQLKSVHVLLSFQGYRCSKIDNAVLMNIKGLVHIKIKIMSSFTQPYVIPNPWEICSSTEHILNQILHMYLPPM